MEKVGRFWMFCILKGVICFRWRSLGERVRFSLEDIITIFIFYFFFLFFFFLQTWTKSCDPCVWLCV